MTCHVSSEFRGEVCVVRCEADGELAALLDAELGRCRSAGACDILLDVDSSVVFGEPEIEVLRRAAAGVHHDGGVLVVAAEEPGARAALAAAGLVRPPLPPPLPTAGDAEPAVVLPDEPHWEHEFVFAATPRDLPAVRRRVTAFAEVAGLHDADLFEFSVAVGEALSNAVVHGSPRGADDDIRVRFFCYDDEIAVEVVDAGDMDVTPICVPAASEVSGRGIHFMRALVDAVQFTCGPLGTHVLLVKRKD